MLNKDEIKQDLISYVERICGIKLNDINTVKSIFFKDIQIRGVELALIINKLIIKYDVDISKTMDFPSFVSINSLVDYIASESEIK